MYKILQLELNSQLQNDTCKSLENIDKSQQKLVDQHSIKLVENVYSFGFLFPRSYATVET